MNGAKTNDQPIQAAEMCVTVSHTRNLEYNQTNDTDDDDTG
jgi:hypothetical protein